MHRTFFPFFFQKHHDTKLDQTNKKMFPTFIWRLPAKILNSMGFQEQKGRRRRKRGRRRPLHTCGSSCISMVRKACKKAEDAEGDLGSMTKTTITLFNSFFPFINSMVHQCLAILLIMDDKILSMEGRIERIVPRSACLFDGVDKLVCGAESLTEKADDVLNKLPTMIHKFPLLEWAVVNLIWFVNIVVQLVCKRVRGKEVKENAVEHTKTVQFEKPYSYADAARKHTEVSKAEVIHLSMKRLQSWKTRIKALEEPLSAGDSPHYSSFQSANTSPDSDEGHPFTYKEILEKDSKEDNREEKGTVHKEGYGEEEEEEESKCYVASELVN